MPNETVADTLAAGGSPAFIPLAAPEIRGNEWRYVKECLDTGWVSSVGAYVERFERAVADRLRVKHAVATVNGTAALHVALQVAGVEPDDEVVMSDLTFIAPANAVRYVGAWPVFVDAEPSHWQIDVAKVAEFLDSSCVFREGVLRNVRTGRRVRALLPVHILGHPCDIGALVEVARRHGLVVVEDATEALGALYRNAPVGNTGDIACFSFNGNKILTTGGGGMIVTDDGRWAERAKYLTTQAKDDPLEYVHNEIGYNYRLTNVQAAMGVAQMEQLDAYVAAKRRIAEVYTRELARVPGITPMAEAAWAFSTNWLFTVLVDESRFGASARTLLGRLEAANVQSRPLWQPMHQSRAHHGAQSTRCEVSERLHREGLSLPCSVGLSDADLARVIATIKEAASSRP